MTPQQVIQSAAIAALAGSRYSNYKYLYIQHKPAHSILCNEAKRKPSIGVIICQMEGVVVLKTGVNTFHGYALADLSPKVRWNIGDKVEISFPGFEGTEVKDVSTVPGIKSLSFGRKMLKPPVEDAYINEMTRQLSELRLPDGRRGLHLLSDLNYSNFTGTSSESSCVNPTLSFDVKGSKFEGKVTIELILGADTYDVHFTPSPPSSLLEDVDTNVTFLDVLDVIEQRCDSSLARVATVTILKPAKKAKVQASPVTASTL
ncbi:MAG: hypothetical protein Q7S87_01245 [Agitococcus sp.]|nr:hypothetical protein [Agitococcus sp.]MDO9179151.1 hypothetical protein [Agitococcus sp.]